MATKKLIEVALPLERINEASSKEKSIRHGHPSTLHLWWARRPLAAARAVIWASLVDDPSSHPERFPTEEDQNRERKRLFNIIEQMVLWKNINNRQILNEAHREIAASTRGNIPKLLDPFAGGGTIPMEAQRLGLEAYAYDLNPVAVMINKATIEIPPLFSGNPPINPSAQRTMNPETGIVGCAGLIEDVNYYGERIRNIAYERVGHIYPKVKIPMEQGGGEANAVAWIWAHTIKCPNPACGCEMPLAKGFTLSKKKGNEAYVEPVFDRERKKITYSIRLGGSKPVNEPKMARGANFKCIMCGEVSTPDYIKKESLSGRLGSTMIGIIAEGKKKRLFVAPSEEQVSAAYVEKPEEYPSGCLSEDRRALWTPLYGLDTFDKLFTNRQLVTMTTLSSLVHEIQTEIEKDAIDAGMPNDHIPLSEGGSGAKAYSQAVAVYLAFAVDREANYCSMQNGWSGDFIIQVFGRQGIPMLWDYAESNPFSDSTGNFSGAVKWVTDAMSSFSTNRQGHAEQKDAQQDCGLRNIMVSTDPPYYDNIGYADLSDYFWLRRSIHDIYPDLFSTLLVPKKEELVAIPYRFDGDSQKAKAFFEDGMLEACKRIYEYASTEYPVSIYYAYKQSETKEYDSGKETVSNGWETMLKSIIDANLMITGTWPIHTERETGLKASVNALASSIVLVCRKRPNDAPQTTRRNLINLLRREIRPALKHLQESNIAPVDLAQSAIGPGMGVFSRYRKVLEADGTSMTVRSALKIINEEIDLYFNEQVGDLDAMSRFCVDLYTQNAFNDIKFGEADVLARAKGTSVAVLASHDVVYAKAGTVHLIERTDLPEMIDENESCIWLLTQQLTHAMATGGVEACAKAVFTMFGSNAERAKDLAYRLYTIAEQKKWASEAFAYNSLVVAWPDIQSRAAMMQREKPEQLDLFNMGLLDS